MTKEIKALRIPSLKSVEGHVKRLAEAHAVASQRLWHRSHGVVVAQGGDAVAFTDTATLTLHGVCTHKADPTRESANTRLICDAQNSLPDLLKTLEILLEVPEARARLEQAHDEWVAGLKPKAAAPKP